MLILKIINKAEGTIRSDPAQKHGSRSDENRAKTEDLKKYFSKGDFRMFFVKNRGGFSEMCAIIYDKLNSQNRFRLINTEKIQSTGRISADHSGYGNKWKYLNSVLKTPVTLTATKKKGACRQ